MSVALLIKDSKAESSLVPVATEATYRTLWQGAAKALALDWVAAMQGGIVVTEENRGVILAQLQTLRGWFEANGHASQAKRVDLLLNALNGVRFDAGDSAWIG